MSVAVAQIAAHGRRSSMRAAFQRLFGLVPGRARCTTPLSPERRRPLWGRLSLEVLGERTVASVSVLGVHMPDLPGPADFGLQSFTWMPATASAHLPPTLSHLFGDQPVGSL